MATIGTKIRDVREARGWTQDELADKAGVTQGAIGHAESGRTKRPRDLPEIARALGVSVEWLLDESDAPYEDWQGLRAAMGAKAAEGKSYQPDLQFSWLDDVSGEMRSIIIELKRIDKTDDSRRRMLVASIGAMLATTGGRRRRKDHDQ